MGIGRFSQLNDLERVVIRTRIKCPVISLTAKKDLIVAVICYNEITQIAPSYAAPAEIETHADRLVIHVDRLDAGICKIVCGAVICKEK